jgi:hypothetical protein
MRALKLEKNFWVRLVPRSDFSVEIVAIDHLETGAAGGCSG